VRKFVEAVGRAVAWTREQPRERVIARMEQIIHKRKRHESASTIKYWKSFGVATAHAELTDREFDRLAHARGSAEARPVKPSDIYTNAFQPQPGALSAR
jgi:hypothetical protein